MTIPLTLRVRRAAGWQTYQVDVDEHASLLDALEVAEQQDPGLLFRHACHHACCGSCGLRVNGRERLACLTPIADLIHTPARLEPLRGFPVLGDLLVDVSGFFNRLHEVNLPPLRSSETSAECVRYESCIECGLCVSACPTASAGGGPAALAAAGRLLAEPRGCSPDSILERAGGDLWRCHSAFACSEVCPTGVDPAAMIMNLRRAAVWGIPAGQS